MGVYRDIAETATMVAATAAELDGLDVPSEEGLRSLRWWMGELGGLVATGLAPDGTPRPDTTPARRSTASVRGAARDIRFD